MNQPNDQAPSMPPEIDTELLLLSMAQAYRSLESYQDTGYVDSIHSPGTANESHSRLNFSTLFRRPNLFRFEWQVCSVNKVEEASSIIWCDGKHAYKQHAGGKVLRRKNLSQLVAGATGVSRGTAQTISALLMNEIIGRRLTDPAPYQLVACELVEGEECYRLQDHGEHDTDLWISTSRTVIRKIFEQYIVDNRPEQSEWLKAQAFKSIRGFIRWLRWRNHFVRVNGLVTREAFHVIDKTHYSQVILNGQIPLEALTLQGI